MRIALAILVPLAAALLQGSVIPFLAIGGARPNMPLLVAASWSLAAGAGEAVWWAFLGGLVTDLLSGGPLGAFAVALLPPVAAIGLGERSTVRPAGVAVGAALVALAALAAGVLYVGALLVAGQPVPAAAILAAEIVGGAVYTGLLATASYPLARWVRRATEKQASF
ncbi:MAG TPA: rod shape-determining protein MreD [Candidatus Saccharimonadales bacterium]|nr:rod shape-determining protein MreD [Candidatus Saccharimonadales bacterium]